MMTGSKFDIENCGNSELNLGELDQRKKLIQLKAFNNTITTINYEIFRGAYNLDSVDLQKNFIADIPNGTFRDLAKLSHLYLNKNRLSKLNVGAFEGLSNLEYLHLGNNQLKILDVGTFDPLKNVRKIDLFLNNLTLIEDGIFLNNKKLFETNLNQNQIFAIGQNAFHWEKLERLNLKEIFCADIERQFSKYDDKTNYLSRHTNCIRNYPHFIELFKTGIESSEKLTHCSNETNYFKSELENLTGLLGECHDQKESISKERDELKSKVDDYEQAYNEEADKSKEKIEGKNNLPFLIGIIVHQAVIILIITLQSVKALLNYC